MFLHKYESNKANDQMSPRVKRSNQKKAIKERHDSISATNMSNKNQVEFDLCNGSVNDGKCELNSEEMFEKLRCSPMTRNTNLKPLSFWSKKLKDLESEKTEKKLSKYGLYEFSASEDSFSPTKKKKKPKRKYTVKNKKPPEFPITIKKARKVVTKSKPKNNVLNSKAIFKSTKLLLEQDKENVDMQNDKKLKSNLLNILTSTPDPSKNKVLLESSNFMLSPIPRHHDKSFKNSNRKNKIHFQSPLKTPKVPNKDIDKKTSDDIEVKCIRVLRSRKILVN